MESVTPLNSIKKHLNGEGKVPSIVAVIKSCTPNGFGDMTVTLKVLFYSFFNSIQFNMLLIQEFEFQDPTGSIGASIHRKVFTEGGFGKDITVGSVLLLQKVLNFLLLDSFIDFVFFFLILNKTNTGCCVFT